MNEVKHHTVSSVLSLHEEVLAAHGGLPGLRDPGLLESAVAAPQASFGGQPLTVDPIEIAGAYLFHLCQNHPFSDGNKRTALAAALVVRAENNLFDSQAELDCDAWEALVLDVAASRIDKSTLTARLRDLLC
jgi:death on curing protein